MTSTTKKLLLLISALFYSSQAISEDAYFDLRTNWLPNTEFNYIRVEAISMSDGRNHWVTLGPARTGDYVRGQRIASFEGMPSGNYTSVVTLLDSRMRAIDGRVASFSVNRREVFTIVITRPIAP